MVKDDLRVGDKKPDKWEAGHCNKAGDRRLGENQEPQIHSCRCFLRPRQGAMDGRAKDPTHLHWVPNVTDVKYLPSLQLVLWTTERLGT